MNTNQLNTIKGINKINLNKNILKQRKNLIKGIMQN